MFPVILIDSCLLLYPLACCSMCWHTSYMTVHCKETTTVPPWIRHPFFLSWLLIKCVLYPELMDEIWCESWSPDQCFDLGDMLCWNQTVDDRWSSLSPLGLCCSSPPLASVWYCINNTKTTDRLWLCSCKQSCCNLFFPPWSTCKSISCAPPSLSSSYTYALADPHPHNHTHIQTLKTNTQTPPDTPPTVTTSEEWSACGEIVVKSWKGSGDTLLLFNPQKVRDVLQCPEGPDVLGTNWWELSCSESQCSVRCGKTVISLGW